MVIKPVYLGKFAKLSKSTVSFVATVRPSARNNTVPTTPIFVIFDTGDYSKLCRENSSFIKI
jgi:hypothetical protein